MFHSHSWSPGVVIAYAPPMEWGMQVDSVSPETLERLVFGVTTYQQTCHLCGEQKTYQVLGTKKNEG